MITDDHKEKKGSISPTAPAPTSPYPQLLAGQGVFGPGPALDLPASMHLPYRLGQLPHSSSTPNLPATGRSFEFERVYQSQFSPGSLPHSFNSSTFPTPFLDALSTTSHTFGPNSDIGISPNPHQLAFDWSKVPAPAPTPKNSRSASPSELEGRQPKRRRGSISGRAPRGLCMTQIHPTQYQYVSKPDVHLTAERNITDILIVNQLLPRPLCPVPPTPPAPVAPQAVMTRVPSTTTVSQLWDIHMRTLPTVTAYRPWDSHR